MNNEHCYQIVVFVPPAYAEEVKQALFDAGAGHYGNYDHCAWVTQGTGQFRPLQDARPFTGQPLETSHVAETRIEMFCTQTALKHAIRALKLAHPYEVPAFHVIPTVPYDA